ncbi:MAG: TraX family protein [Clostridia bacterium]|nr:TraX family protein [Clostridia bacterium]
METLAAQKTRGLNGNALKLIAILAMTIDHFTSVVHPGYGGGAGILLLHAIGRLTAPIMCYLVAEGYHYTHDVKKYTLRLFALAVISHFAYNFCFGIPFMPFKTGIFNQTSVIWPYAWALVVLQLERSENPGLKPWMKAVLYALIGAITFPSDWSCIAMLVIVAFSHYRGNFKRQMIEMMVYVAFYAAVYCLFVDVRFGLLQLCVALAILPLSRYNGERGQWKGMKWFFYFYYPAHLFLLGLLRLALHGNIGVIVGGA